MKIDPDLPNPDLCQTSIDELAGRCRNFFARQSAASPCWCVDAEEGPPSSSDGQVMNVVLFGGFLRRFFESGNWPLDRLRLWVLSTSVRDVLVSLLGVPPEAVGVIPRRALFPPEAGVAERRDWPDLTVPVTLVFGGRLSPTKNIEMLVRTVFHLQKEWHRPARLELCGDFDDQSHPDQGRRERGDHEARIRRLIGRLPWTKAPELRPKQPGGQWLRRDFINPVFVSLSTFICEDFGVAAEQARAAGWPCWLSDWGGHREIGGLGVRRIPVSLIGGSHEPEELIDLKARALAARLARGPGGGDTGADLDGDAPETVTAPHLDGWRREALGRLGPEAHRLYRDSIEMFADSSCGRRFFSAYRQVFSGSLTPGRPWVILVNDFNAADRAWTRNAADICARLLDEAIAAERDVVFVPLREIKSAAFAPVWLAAERVILPFRAPGGEELLETLPRLLRPDCRVGFAGAMS